IGHRSDESGARAPEFFTRLADSVLAHDGAEAAASGLFKSPQCPQCAGIVDGGDKRTLRLCLAQVAANHVEAVLELASAIQMDHGASVDARQRLAEAGHHAADPQLR